MSIQGNRAKRNRGVILSSKGWQRLQAAQIDLEREESREKAYSLEDLSELTGLSPHTLIKVRRQEIPVDRQTLKAYFNAFSLTLMAQDYFKPDQTPVVAQGSIDQTEDLNESLTTQLVEPEFVASKADLDSFHPEGQVPLGSLLYLDRPPAEIDCYQAILQPGALIRVRAPRRMGKTSLVLRILDQAKQKGCLTVFLSFQLAEQAILQDLTQFLQWFSANVGRKLDLSNQLTHYWDDMFGSKMSCKIYFEQYLLTQTLQPIVLALDDVDRLFQYPDLADEFFGLLRIWHEEAKNQEVWQRLRLVVAHSTKVYIPLNVNKSPFNVGLPIELKEFTIEQVGDLAERYGLGWSRTQTKQLMVMTNGHPYLIQLALNALWRKQISLKTLLQSKASSTKIYDDHLQRQFWMLEQEPELATAFTQVLKSSTPIPLELPLAFKLESMGLVQLQGSQATPYCSLYNQYFRDRLSIT